MPSRRFMFYQRVPQGGNQPDKVVPAIFCADLKAAQTIAEALLKCNPEYADMLIPFEVTLKSNLDINRDKQFTMDDLTKRNFGLSQEEQQARDSMENENRVRKEEQTERASGEGYSTGNTPLDSATVDTEEMRQFREWQRQNRATAVPGQVTQGNQGTSELTADERAVLESEPDAEGGQDTDNQDRQNGGGRGQKKSENVQDQGHIGTDGTKADWKQEEQSQGNGKRGRSQPRQ